MKNVNINKTVFDTPSEWKTITDDQIVELYNLIIEEDPLNLPPLSLAEFHDDINWLNFTYIKGGTSFGKHLNPSQKIKILDNILEGIKHLTECLNLKDDPDLIENFKLKNIKKNSFADVIQVMDPNINENITIIEIIKKLTNKALHEQCLNLKTQYSSQSGQKGGRQDVPRQLRNDFFHLFEKYTNRSMKGPDFDDKENKYRWDQCYIESLVIFINKGLEYFGFNNLKTNTLKTKIINFLDKSYS